MHAVGPLDLGYGTAVQTLLNPRYFSAPSEPEVPSLPRSSLMHFDSDSVPDRHRLESRVGMGVGEAKPKCWR